MQLDLMTSASTVPTTNSLTMGKSAFFRLLYKVLFAADYLAYLVLMQAAPLVPFVSLYDRTNFYFYFLCLWEYGDKLCFVSCLQILQSHRRYTHSSVQVPGGRLSGTGTK